ncbi:DNA-directed RNA polymerase subunit K [Candidatus Micrarchaeota archaeon CG1_02_51_15]|nr:MAG: DNA-directed RNA polymerase subunit K [Candidatus Micrarchaeota archaeon CG1_02_51_15]
MAKKVEVKLSKYEKARIIGARALQLAMGAPTLIKLPKGVRSPIRLAFLELEAGVIPLQVVRVAAIN